MKKLAVSVLLLFAVVFSASKAYAENISESTARQLGAYYMSVMSGQQEADPSQVYLVYTFTNPTNSELPTAWIFNVKGQGYVIVAGSDYSYPILAYSTEGMLDPQRIAPSLLAFYGDYARRIGYAQDNNLPLFNDTKAIANEWNELYNRTLSVAAPKAQYWLMDEGWGQGDPYEPTYNKLCPSGTDSDGNTAYCYTGCVATAMAMIMHYWQYPVQGKGYIGYNCYINESTYYGYIDINLQATHYDYSKMPNRLYSSTPADQVEAVALLNFHAGVSVEMGYGFDGSGTQSNLVPNAMKKKFKYASADYLQRTNVNYSNMTETNRYTDDQWIAMCKAEIDSLRPIYYSAYSRGGSGRDAGGHAFILDGMHPTNGDKAHFNWGWDGTPNIWSDLRTGDLSVPASYGGYNFNFAQAMVSHIQPPADSCIHTPQSIDRAEGAELLPAFPNPTTSMITIPYNANNQTLNMDIYSIEGRLMESVELVPNANSVQINVSSYPKGIYIYRVGSQARKFMVR